MIRISIPGLQPLQGQEMILASVAGMRPNPWQEDATGEAMGLSLTAGKAVGLGVRDRLAGD